jgi:hypothetical protein
MEIGDHSADLLADLQERSNRLPQKTMLANQLFDPVAEDVAARLADAQAEVLQQTPDLVAEVTLGIDQLRAAA